MFCYGIFIVGTLMSLAISGRWFQPGELDVINLLAGFNIVDVQTMGGWGIPKQIKLFFNAMVTVLGWKYPYLENPWGTIFKMVILYPCTLGVVIHFVELMSSVIQGIASTVRSLMPG